MKIYEDLRGFEIYEDLESFIKAFEVRYTEIFYEPIL